MTLGALGQASSLQEPRAIAALSSRATLGWCAGKKRQQLDFRGVGQPMEDQIALVYFQNARLAARGA